MAVKASNTITLVSVKDVDAITPYYYQQASTVLTPPAKPQVKPPPSPWQTAQPSFNYESSVYICFLIEFSDSTWEYSDVSLWSEYEASKQVYNTADNALGMAENAMGTASDALGKANDALDGLDGKVDTSYLMQYLKYDPNIGLILANGIDETTTRIKAVLKSDRLSFYQDNVEVAYISNQQLYITQSVVLQQMDLGKRYDGVTGFGQWSWKVHKNGETPPRNNLNLKWVG